MIPFCTFSYQVSIASSSTSSYKVTRFASMNTGKTLPERSLGIVGLTASIQVIIMSSVSAETLDHRIMFLIVLLNGMSWLASALSRNPVG